MMNLKRAAWRIGNTYATFWHQLALEAEGDCRSNQIQGGSHRLWCKALGLASAEVRTYVKHFCGSLVNATAQVLCGVFLLPLSYCATLRYSWLEFVMFREQDPQDVQLKPVF